MSAHNPFAASTAATKTIPSAIRTPGAPASALHKATIKAAYLTQNSYDPKDLDMVILAELESGYEAKIQKKILQNGAYEVINDRTKKKELLFSYVTVSHIIGAAIPGSTMEDVWPSIQTKKVEIYDFDTRKNVLTDVQMVTDLVGKQLYLGLQRKISNKNVFDETTQKWVPQAEKKETLEFGCAGSIADRRSFTEINNNVDPANAKDLDKWEKLNTGKDYNAYKEVKPAAVGTPAGVAVSKEAPVIDFSATS